jgi:ribosomal protein S18 acetylase RimI-like enzyme
MAPLLLRIATYDDVPALVRLINAAFVVEQVAIEGERIDSVGVQKYLQTGEFLVLEQNTAIAGCVYLEKRGQRGYLGLLSVDPALQGQGLGRKLVTAAEKQIREQGCVAIDLRVISARGELLPFYQKLGYGITHISPMPPEAPLKMPCHFIHLSKQLL